MDIIEEFRAAIAQQLWAGHMADEHGGDQRYVQERERAIRQVTMIEARLRRALEDPAQRQAAALERIAGYLQGHAHE